MLFKRYTFALQLEHCHPIKKESHLYLYDCCVRKELTYLIKQSYNRPHPKQVISNSEGSHKLKADETF